MPANKYFVSKIHHEGPDCGKWGVWRPDPDRTLLAVCDLKGEACEVALALNGRGITYICAHCGDIAEASVEILDSGTTLTCNRCGKYTIVDLDTPEARAERYKFQSDAKSAAWQRYWQERGF